jgi:hypothetical protein
MIARMEYLEYSIVVENAISVYLSSLLDIKKGQQSLSFGHKSTSLSFRSKVNLLLDMKIFDKNDDWKLVKFMEIRNQFMHNQDADNYEKCLAFITGAKNKLLDNYPQLENILMEDQLRKASLALAEEVLEIVDKILKKVVSNNLNKGYKIGLAITSYAAKKTIQALQEKALLSDEPDKISLTEYWELFEINKKEADSMNFELTSEEIINSLGTKTP